MSYKNRLQEYYQKHPNYKGVSLKKILVYLYEKTPHGFFISTLSTPHGMYISKPKPKKVDAEQNASKLALKDIDESHSSDYNEKICFKTHENSKHVIVVDIENFSDFMKKFELFEFNSNHIEFVGVLSSSHPLSEKPWPENIQKLVVKSTRKDVSDTAITMYIASDMVHHKYSKEDSFRFIHYVILTRDHFASNIGDIVKSSILNVEWYDYIFVNHVTSYQELKDLFNIE